MANQFSWHKEYYVKAMTQIVNYAGKYTADESIAIEGWLLWFAEHYPKQYRKYENALAQISMLWGDMDPKEMEEFKKAVKIEVDGTKWAVDKYLEWQAQQREAEALKGTQEALV